jgi:hypothetical protein
VTSAHRAALLLATSFVLGARLVAQRPVLPYALKAGRHDAATRSVTVPGGALRAWYPATCGRPAPAPATPCSDAPVDSGSFPLVLLAAGPSGLVREDTVLALYLASHGYIVAAPDVRRAGSAHSLADALAALDALAGVDSLRIAVVGRGPAVAAAREIAQEPRVRTLVELDPPEGGDAEQSAARQLPTLVVLRASAGVAPAHGAQRVTVRLPPVTDRRRLSAAVTHLFLSSALRGWGDSLPAMAARLRRLGL